MSTSIKKALRTYEGKNTSKALVHVLTSLPFVLFLFVFNYQCLIHHSFLLFSVGTVLQIGFLTRLFMILHDCGHYNFVANKTVNLLLGKLVGFLMFVPFELWKVIHNKHHAGAGNLDERSILDVVTLTIEEYQELNPLYKFAYRVFRSAWFQLLIYQQTVFLIGFRIPYNFFTRKGQVAVMKNNIAYVIIAILAYQYLDWQALLFSIVVVYSLTYGFGSFIFFIQHQFEDVYWSKGNEYEFDKAGIAGSSYWKLPSLLKWVTGNVGFHHIHHLNIGISNYHLEKAHNEVIIQNNIKVPTLDIWSSFSLFKYKLYDTKQNKMVAFPERN